MKHKAGVNLKCRECEIAFITRDGFDDEWCPMCGGVGTIVPDKAEQPTAIAGTDSARRIGEADSEAVVDGAAPLCDGLVELERYLDGRWSEAIAVFNDLSSYRLDGPELAAVRSAANARRSLVEVREYLESVGAISPAQSERSQP